MDMTQDEIRVMTRPEIAARDLFEVLATGDVALARRTVAGDFHNREAAVGPAACSRPGPAGVLASSAWLRYAFEGLRFPISELVSSDDRVWVRLRLQGLHIGAFVQFHEGRLAQAVPPTGREVDFEQLHLLTVRDGLVVNHEAVRDDITMLGQLGVFPPSPRVGSRMLAWRLSGRAGRAADAVSAAADEAASSADA